MPSQQKSIRRMSEMLGQPYTSAMYNLRAIILFELVKETRQNICFQCGKAIESKDDLSVEHKTPWMTAENKRECFFDLNNIAFSHRKCNSAAGRKLENLQYGPGEKNSLSKLTAEQVREMRAIYKQGDISYAELARKYDVNAAHVSRIIRRLNWSHIE
jgi:hypothetical protein